LFLIVCCFGASSAVMLPNFAKRGIRVKPAQTSSTKERLIAKLKSSQNPEINPDGLLNVKISMFIQCADLDKQTNVLHTQLYERFSWNDSRLSWNPEEFDDIKMITINPRHIWTPNIRLTNSFMAVEERFSPTVRVSQYGGVLLVSHAFYTTLCSPSTSAADAYNCALRLEPWDYNSATLNVDLADNTRSDTVVVDSGFLCPYRIEKPTTDIFTASYETGDYQTFQVKFTIRDN